jgi:hypothetical protein
VRTAGDRGQERWFASLTRKAWRLSLPWSSRASPHHQRFSMRTTSSAPAFCNSANSSPRGSSMR